MAGMPHNDVIENFDLQELARSDEITGKFDVRLGCPNLHEQLQGARLRGRFPVRPLRDDFQRLNLVPCEREEESKVNRTAGKVPNQMTGDDRLPVLLVARERLACVLILCRGIRLPGFDGGASTVSVALVLHDGIFSETLRNGLAVTAVCGEVSGDGFWQAE